MTPLHLVSMMGDVVVAKVLFGFNPDVNALTTVRLSNSTLHPS
jgi:hypothetical protein